MPYYMSHLKTSVSNTALCLHTILIIFVYNFRELIKWGHLHEIGRSCKSLCHFAENLKMTSTEWFASMKEL